MGQSITFTSSGSWDRTEAFLKKAASGQLFTILNKYGQMGISALAAATPSETGETAASWTCEVVIGSGTATLTWRNTHMAGDTSVAILLQYGHGTGTGGYIPGRDFINPAMKPLFEQMVDEVWKEVMTA